MIRTAYHIEHPVPVLLAFKWIKGGIQFMGFLQEPELDHGKRRIQGIGQMDLHSLQWGALFCHIIGFEPDGTKGYSWNLQVRDA